MKRRGWIGMLVGGWALAAMAQQTIQSPVLMGVDATPLGDQLTDERIDHRPLAQEDRTLKVGRELKQGEAIVKITPQPAQAEAADSRVRARALLVEDRERVKQAAALAD
jgi:hypothetical protein